MTNTNDSAISRRETAIARDYADFARQTGATKPELPRTWKAADDLIALAAVDSTNILARTMMANGELPVVGEDGHARMAVICADAQTAGHGRLGRQWSAQAGGASFLVTYATALPERLVVDPARNGWFTIAAGLASLDALNGALAECGAKPLDSSHGLQLKWPNDIFYDGHKLGGILAELVELPDTANSMMVPWDVSAKSPADSHDERLGNEPRNARGVHAKVIMDGRGIATNECRVEGEETVANVQKITGPTSERAVGVMFGIGMNLDIAREALPTPVSTSLQLLYAPLPDSPTLRDMVAARLAESLRSRLARLAAGTQEAFDDLLAETRPVCWTLGRQVEAKFTDGLTLRGKALSLNPDASLVIEDSRGVCRTVHTADVGVLA
ncbi:biotin--acetyl-CoA-carboxylase ligase [Bifidobacterium sp. ESL0775]|uniref:biotin--[acetyl-CoA-carboxylase] ligase n=1 Tax=Bifidobacterium sp. ESL0775 TaxID=2983230 RepID=UPI0023F82A3B|nr:biotin--acetyl-CoA-carboxylase ligase [Bifidobacterium sp. ESL0775]WEV69665.1 biotin--acetyl-CoA-carboxylase ligase [Bifidobacterium sp. ESL0775]